MKKIILTTLILLVLLMAAKTTVATGEWVNTQKVDIYHVSDGSSDYVLQDQAYKGHVI